jgi:hypothetical protein
MFTKSLFLSSEGIMNDVNNVLHTTVLVQFSSS